MNNRAVVGVVVDSGHGGSDPGAVSGNLREKDFTLKAALYMYDRLRQLGIPAVLTKDFDEDISREERLKRANEAFGPNANVILISNHINAGGGEGAEVIYALRNSSTLAQDILESIGQEGQIMRKYYQRRLPEDPSKDYYYIIRQTDPLQSLLVEYGFIDNANDQKKLQNNLLDYVEAVVRAIARYAGVAYVPPSGTNTYTVKKGDSLWSIANQYGITVSELRSANNLTSDTLQVGQILKIPTSSGGNDSSSSSTRYTVQSGDSLWSIANRYGVSVNALRQANNLTTDVLQIGQVLVIPGTNSGGSDNENNDSNFDQITYVVEPGDSLWSIANQYGITVNELRNANNLTSDTLSIGQILVIPSGSNNSGSGGNEGTPSEEITYTVKSGDSLWSIAKNYGITVDELKNANNLLSNTLQIGQVLVIPISGNNSSGNATTVYTVKRDDSLWLIANRYNTTVDEIKRLNNLTSNVLQIGQQLLVPTR